MPKTRLLIENFDKDDCEVAFEPWGTVETLRPDDTFAVEISGPGDGLVEIAYWPGGMSVCAWMDDNGHIADVTARNKAGAKLRI